MFKVIKRGALAILAAASLFGISLPAAAYPDRPITMIVPWGAGGGTDTLARTFAAMLEEELGQPINVVNRTGAGGVVGHTAMATAAADGYTIGLGTVEFTTYRPLAQGDIGPDSFTLLCRLASLPAGITVKAGAPWNSAAELLAAIKEDDAGTYISSGSGVGGAWHLSVAGWLNAEGVDPLKIRFVPSKGGAPALQDVVAGGITMYTGSISEGKALADAGEVRLLAIMHPERIDALSDVETIAESTGTDWAASSWFSFMAPPELPAEVEAKLTDAATTVWSSDQFQGFMAERGYVPAGECGDDFDAFAEQVATDTAEVIGKLGLGQ